MTATTAPAIPARRVAATSAARAFDVRRVTAVVLPAATAALLVAATVTDPGAGSEGSEMIRIYADQVDQLQWHAALLHWAYGLWGLIPIALAGLARGRGRQWLNVAAVLGALVALSMPALMMSDLFFAGIANHLDVATADRIGNEMIAGQWAVRSYLLPGLPSLALCLPIAFVGLARAGRVPKWAPVVALVAFPVFMVSTGTLPGAIAAAACLVTLSVVLARWARD
jgi:hypothetical protein